MTCQFLLTLFVFFFVVILGLSLLSGKTFGSRTRVTRKENPGDYWSSIVILVLILIILLSMVFQVNTASDFLTKWLAPAFQFGFVWLIFPFFSILSIIRGKFKTAWHFDEDWETIRRSEDPKKFWVAVYSSIFMGIFMFAGSLFLAYKK